VLNLPNVEQLASAEARRPSRLSRRRRGIVTAAVAVALLASFLTPGSSVATAAPSGAAPGQKALASKAAPGRQASSAQRASDNFSYDLVTALGGVYNLGGAGWYGNEKWRHLAAPIVGMAVTPDGRGYWLVGANGSVFNLGDAAFYGSLAGEVLGFGEDIVGISATADGKGYWLINQSGAVISFGDAAPIDGGRPLPASDLALPIISGAIAPGGAGAWFTDVAGRVFNVGGAPFFGSRAAFGGGPFVSIAAIPSGRGYWLANSAGQVWAYAGASPGSTPQGLSGAAVGMIPAQNRFGYWLATSNGTVIEGGDATARASGISLGHLSAIVGIAAAPAIQPTPLPAGAVGYDINWPQCAGGGSSQAGVLPGPPTNADGSMAYSIAVVGVDGWATGDNNPCLGAEATWAQKAVYPKGYGSGAPPYDLYMFLNSPASNSTIDQTGPGGTCAKLSGSAWENCLAYNYGYNSALGAVNYASSQSARSRVWWLDIENDSCAPGMWNDAANGEWWSCDLWLNAKTIQGAIDGLRSLGVTPGIYCTSVQWAGITGSYVPTGGAPLIWIAGAIWTSPPYPQSYGFVGPGANTKYCTDSQYFFAGGRPVMLQETPGGGNNYAYDPDVAC
jgi:hypothetical protein